jgi:hypothetical protein
MRGRGGEERRVGGGWIYFWNCCIVVLGAYVR